MTEEGWEIGNYGKVRGVSRLSMYQNLPVDEEEEELIEKKNEVETMTSGVPGSGKSKYIKKADRIAQQPVISAEAKLKLIRNILDL